MKTPKSEVRLLHGNECTHGTTTGWFVFAFHFMIFSVYTTRIMRGLVSIDTRRWRGFVSSSDKVADEVYDTYFWGLGNWIVGIWLRFSQVQDYIWYEMFLSTWDLKYIDATKGPVSCYNDIWFTGVSWCNTSKWGVDAVSSRDIKRYFSSRVNFSSSTLANHVQPDAPKLFRSLTETHMKVIYDSMSGLYLWDLLFSLTMLALKLMRLLSWRTLQTSISVYSADMSNCSMFPDNCGPLQPNPDVTVIGLSHRAS